MRRLLLFISFFSIFSVVEAQLNINHYLRVGRSRIAIGNYTGAIDYFNVVIKFKPNIPEAYFYRGAAKAQLEDYRGAIIDFNQAIDIKPFYPDAYLYRGMAYHNLHKYDRAIEDYNQALKYEKENEGIYNNRGIAKMALKDYDGAVEDYNQALRINPKSTHALMSRSNAKIFNGDTKGAVEDLNKVIIIRPHYAAAYLNRGLSRFEQKDYASALRDYDQSIRFDAKNPLAYNNRGIVKQKLKDYNSAIMDYDKAIGLDPTMASAYFNRAIARERLNIEGYEMDYRIAAQLNPKFDLNKRRIAAQQLAQNTNQSKIGSQNQNSVVDSTSTTPKKSREEIQAEIDRQNKADRDRRRSLGLMVQDTRDFPNDNIDDGKVQNRDIVIDLQPIFIVTAFNKENVDYERFQYYSNSIEKLNEQNDRNPILGITNQFIVHKTTVNNDLIKLYTERIEIEDQSNNYLTRGILYSLENKFHEAFLDIDTAISLDKNLSIAYFVRANARFKMQTKLESVESIDNTVKVNIDSGTIKSKVAADSVVYESIDYQQILDDYEKLLELSPDNFFGYFNRASVWIRFKDYNKALNDLNKAIEIEPEFAEAYFNRGLTKIYLNDVDGGALDLSRAGELGIEGAYNIIKRYSY